MFEKNNRNRNNKDERETGVRERDRQTDRQTDRQRLLQLGGGKEVLELSVHERRDKDQ